MWDDTHGGKGMSIPEHALWLNFLRYQAWADTEVLGRQPDCYVAECWFWYKLQSEFGLLTQ